MTNKTNQKPIRKTTTAEPQKKQYKTTPKTPPKIPLNH
jgi:hypothetical protein